MRKISRKIKDASKIGYVLTLTGIGLIVAMLYLGSVGNVVEKQYIDMERFWLQAFGDANPGVGASGVLRVYIVRHQDNGTEWYASHNITINESVYIYGDYNNSYLNNSSVGVDQDVPYNTAFDIVVKVRWNQTHAWNSTAPTSWEWIWVNAFCNASVLGIATAEMSEANITDATPGGQGTFAFAHYYLNNSNNGYTISRGQNVTSCSFNFNAYF